MDEQEHNGDATDTVGMPQKADSPTEGNHTAEHSGKQTRHLSARQLRGQPLHRREAPSDSNKSDPILQIFIMSLLLVGLMASVALIAWGGSDKGISMSTPPWVVDYQHRVHNGYRASDVRVSLTVTLSDIYFQKQLNITYARHVVCQSCGGRGALSSHMCPACRGSGQVVTRAGFAMYRQTCPQCGGRGAVVDEHCSACHGHGAHTEHATIPITLTSGLRSGDVIKVIGRGNEHPQAMPGDLTVQIEEIAGRTDPASLIAGRCVSFDECQSRNDDLEVSFTVSLKEALLGWQRTVTLPNGERTLVQMSEVVQPGQHLIIRGKGMPRRSASARARTLVGHDYLQELQNVDEPVLADAFEPSMLCKIPLLNILACHDHSEFGDLHVRVHVSLPARLSSQQHALIDQAFDGVTFEPSVHLESSEDL